MYWDSRTSRKSTQLQETCIPRTALSMSLPNYCCWAHNPLLPRRAVFPYLQPSEGSQMITKQRPNVTPQSSGPNREKQKHTETTRQRAMWMTRQTFFLSQCCDVTVSESVICKTQQQTQLASTRITNQDQFKEVVIITFKSHPGACVHATSKRVPCTEPALPSPHRGAGVQPSWLATEFSLKFRKPTVFNEASGGWWWCGPSVTEVSLSIPLQGCT